MKRILCLTDGFTLGGAERQLIGLAHLLKENEYEVDLACYHENNFYKDLMHKYDLKCTILYPKGRFGKFLEVRKFINKGNYDYVIAYKDGATMIASILKLLGMKPKLIVSERNTTQVLTKRERFKFWLYKFADFIVPNSYSQGEFIQTHFSILKKKTVVITNFTDTQTFVPIKNYKSDNILNIVIAGRIAEQKNILRFLDVLKRLKDLSLPYHFQWFGNVSAGEHEYEDEIKKRLYALKLEDMIDFLPATNNIKEEYQKCDAFCLPSLYEGYPNVVCEAMSCGKPILCSKVCDNPFIVEEEINGFMFNPISVEDMVFVFERFASLSFDERAIMGGQSRRIAEEKFSEEAFVHKYIKLIES